MTAAGAHDGQFLAGAHDGQAFSVIAGILGDPGFTKTSFESPEDLGVTPSINFVAWDGEAFNVELHAVGRSTWAVRLNPDGSVKQPPTKYGLMADSSYEGYDLGYKISTNATSGVTHLFSATYERMITGHTRNDKRLPWGGRIVPAVLLGASLRGFGHCFRWRGDSPSAVDRRHGRGMDCVAPIDRSGS
jgi:hypothetical protein